jgi:hypothetical protein
MAKDQEELFVLDPILTPHEVVCTANYIQCADTPAVFYRLQSVKQIITIHDRCHESEVCVIRSVTKYFFRQLS